MNKTQLKVVQDTKEAIDKAKEKFSNLIDEIISKTIDKEIENIGNLQDELQGEFDELSEKQQEGDKGTKLTEEIEALENLKNELDTFKAECDDSVFDDIISRIDDVPGVHK
jgi:hypothetical protein